MKNIVCMLAFVFLAGCSTTSILVMPPKPIKRNPPAAAMEPCDKSDELKDESMGGLVMAVKNTADAFHACESKRKELSDWINRGEE